MSPRGKGGRGRAFFERVDPLTSLMLVFPLFLLYEVGILVVPGAFNGADLITVQMIRLLHGKVSTYIAVNAALAVVFVGAVAYLRKGHKFDPSRVWPVAIESCLYALTMGSLICFVMVDLLHVDPRLSLAPLRAGPESSPGLLASIIISIGAGVHEELLFRVLLLGGIVFVLERVLGMRRLFALAFAFLVSSVLFSAAHHIVGGEPFRVGAFVYRILCGLFFASLYQWRGLAVAVYTHTLYDIYVFIFS